MDRRRPTDPPNVPPWKQGFISASIIGAAGTLTALYHRDVSGEGQHVDVSMQEALSLDQETAMQTWDMNQALRARNGGTGIIPFEIPGSGFTSAPTATSSDTSVRRGGDLAEMLEWMTEEGLAEDLVEEPYPDFCANLNLRFLTRM